MTESRVRSDAGGARGIGYECGGGSGGTAATREVRIARSWCAGAQVSFCGYIQAIQSSNTLRSFWNTRQGSSQSFGPLAAGARWTRDRNRVQWSDRCASPRRSHGNGLRPDGVWNHRGRNAGDCSQPSCQGEEGPQKRQIAFLRRRHRKSDWRLNSIPICWLPCGRSAN